MGSEMCIRDRDTCHQIIEVIDTTGPWAKFYSPNVVKEIHDDVYGCLLYTSDAADERSSVDLGGRRIIKNNKRGRPR